MLVAHGFLTLGFLFVLSDFAFGGGPIVNTDCGAVEGFKRNNHYAFLGIPYAEPPVEKLRWQAPVPLKPSGEGRCWPEPIYNATFARNVCVQSFQGTSYGTEDCLFLEVHTPTLPSFSDSPSSGENNAARLLPVFVWIHGGGLSEGAAQFNFMYGSPETFADENRAVVVSIDYRLGFLGFLTLEELTNQKGNTDKTRANYGLLDCIMALKWAQKNVAAFGGDPDKIPIVGESAGGELVLALVASPLAKGLFLRGYSMSGLPGMTESLEESYTVNYELVIPQTPCANVSRGTELLDCLYSIPGLDWGEIYVQCPAFRTHPIGVPTVDTLGDAALIVIDGWSIPKPWPDAFVDGVINDVDLILGTLREEVDMFPLVEMLNYTQDEFEAFVTETFDAFAIGMGDEVLQLYPFDDYETAQQAYDNIATDIVMTCPNLRLSRGASKYLSNLYSFIVVQKPQHPICFRGPQFYCAHYAFHAYDSFAMFWNSPMFVPQMGPNDEIFGKFLRDMTTTFMQSGEFPPAFWPRFRSPTSNTTENVMLLATNYQVRTNPKSQQCQFWENHGFEKYTWTN